MDKITNPLFSTTDENGQQFVMLNMEGTQEATNGQYVMDAEGNIHLIMMEEGEDQTNQESTAAAAPADGEFYLDEAMATAALANGGQIEINGVLYQLQTSGDDPNTMLVDMSTLPAVQQPIFTGHVDADTLDQISNQDSVSKAPEESAELPELNEGNVSPEIDEQSKLLTDRETTDLSEFLDIKSSLNKTKTDEEPGKLNQLENNDENSTEIIKYIQVPSGKDGQPINIQISTDRSNSSHKVIILPMSSASNNNTTSASAVNISTTASSLTPNFNIISKNQIIKQGVQAKGRTITFDKLKSDYKYYPKTKKGSTTELNAAKNQITPKIEQKPREPMEAESDDEFCEEIADAKQNKSQLLKGKSGKLKVLPKESKLFVRTNLYSNKSNKGLMCRPAMCTKATSCNPIKVAKITQTDLSDEEEKIYLPIPTPFFVPTPVFEGTRPVPRPIALPLPIPVPLYIPMSKEAVSAALTELKVIYDSLPSDEEGNREEEQDAEIVLKKIAEDDKDTEVEATQREVNKVAVVAPSLNDASGMEADIEAMNQLVDKDDHDNVENVDSNVQTEAVRRALAKSKMASLVEEINNYIPVTAVRRVPINCTKKKKVPTATLR